MPSSSAMPITKDPNLFSTENPDFDEDGWEDDPRFLVETEDVEAAAAALQAAASRLMRVAASGRVWADPRDAALAWDYTPNYVSDVEVTERGVSIWADTKSTTTPQMAAAMVDILLEELDARGVEGVLTGDGKSTTLWDPSTAVVRPPACRCVPGPDQIQPGPGGFFCPDCGGGVIRKNGDPWD
jgi:hypothetical protein